VSGWTDAHCHLQERYLSDDPEVQANVVATLARAQAAGVDRVVVVGTDVTTSEEAVALAEATTGPVEIYATVGLHPHDAINDLAPIEALARAKSPKLVGIGECGLDYFYEHSPRDQQKRTFAAQIRLAHELDLALVIHARDAWPDLFEVLDGEGMPPRTVIHCFTGGPAEAEACLERGADISIAGVVTFKNAADLRAALSVVPLERLHVETDSPFLAPVPHRGRTNEPALVAIVGEFIADQLGIEVSALQNATRANTARLFRLPLG
jgi:TatD DNase family protein